MKEKIVRRNLILYVLRESFYACSLFFSTGTLIQLFLTMKGASSSQIGTFNALMQVMYLVFLMSFSTYAEKHPDARKQSGWVLVLFSVCFVGFLPAVLLDHMSVGLVLTISCVTVGIQSLFMGIKGVLEYKICYQILPVSKFGVSYSLTGIVSGLVGVLFSGIVARLLEVFSMKAAFVFGFFMAAGLGLLAFVCNHLLVQIDSFQEQKKKKRVVHAAALFHRPEFYRFIIPNTARGIAHGMMLSIVLFANQMEISVAGIARLAVLASFANVAANILYLIVSRRISNRTACLAGALFAGASAFLPLGGKEIIFLTAYFFASAGKGIVDITVPVVVAEMIDPSISGVYNAWRNAINSIACALSAYVVGILIDYVPVAVFCMICAAGYIIAGISYYIGGKRKYQI